MEKSFQGKSSEIALYTVEDKAQLGAALGACLAVQRTYGKQAADFDKVVQVFIRVLSEYESGKVIAAIKKWVMSSPEFPTPADILNILSPQPKFDYGVYNSILAKVKRGDRLTAREGRYLKAYEENAMRGV